MTPRHYAFETLYAALRAGLIDWPGIQASQEANYGRCANGCGAAGQWRTIDGRELCGPCYLQVAADERRRFEEQSR